MLCFVAVLLWSCSCSAGVYGIWSCFDWSCSMMKMALKNLEISTVFMWYFIIRGRGRFCSTVRNLPLPLILKYHINTVEFTRFFKAIFNMLKMAGYIFVT